MPNLYVIGGANGSGKTTVALSLLPNVLGVYEYVNADAIASGLSPLNPESMAIPSGRIMVERLQALAESGADFAFETTLAARTFAPFLRDCRNKGYQVNLIYLWLPSPDLAVARVARRVASGGHSIPEEVVRRRYERGRQNLVNLYLPLCDNWTVYENSGSEFRLVAGREMNREPVVYDREMWEQINGSANE
jgi:predicted ABC-type ATPase